MREELREIFEDVALFPTACFSLDIFGLGSPEFPDGPFV